MIRMVLAVAVGGALGAVMRFLMAIQTERWLGSDFPWGTLSVNILGSLLMGILIEASAQKFSPSPEVRALLAIGFLGGFTTFSAFALDVGLLLEKDELPRAFVYVVASVVLSIGAFFGGLSLVRAWIA